MEIFKLKPHEIAQNIPISHRLCAWLMHWEGFGFAVEKLNSKSGEVEESDSKGSGVRCFYISDIH